MKNTFLLSVDFPVFFNEKKTFVSIFMSTNHFQCVCTEMATICEWQSRSKSRAKELTSK